MFAVYLRVCDAFQVILEGLFMWLTQLHIWNPACDRKCWCVNGSKYPFPLLLHSQQPTTPGEPINFPSATKLNHVFRCKRTKPRTPFDDF